MNNVLSQRRSCKNFDRSPHRLRQATHLAKCGGRVILEALIDIASGRDLDTTLADFERLSARLYHAAIYFADALSDDEAA